MNMKTIEIQNCTDFKDRSFIVNINDEKLAMRHQFLSVQVADNKPLVIRANYFWDASSKYSFEPKDNMTLQVSVNRRMIQSSLILGIIAIVMVFIFGYFYENGRFINYASLVCLLPMVIYQTIRRKKYFVIKEINH